MVPGHERVKLALLNSISAQVLRRVEMKRLTRVLGLLFVLTAGFGIGFGVVALLSPVPAIAGCSSNC